MAAARVSSSYVCAVHTHCRTQHSEVGVVLKQLLHCPMQPPDTQLCMYGCPSTHCSNSVCWDSPTCRARCQEAAEV
jgi:hypothetical protein